MKEILTAFWHYIVLTAPYLILGFLVSGLVRQFLNLETLKKHLGGKGFLPVVKASLFGVPLPLCSCSVIPAAVTLKKEGIGNGPTSSFLISTPESGVDSFIMTYGVMDIPMTIIRPIAAFVTAFVAGFLQNIFNTDEVVAETHQPGASCGHDHAHEHGHDHEHGSEKKGALRNILEFSFVELSDDLAWWLFIGLFVGALMNLYLPIELFQALPKWSEKLVVLAFGIPFYICASASTPIAASMMMKGMSPGTALIFLLVGPATNFTNIAVLQKYIGKKGIIINVIAISLVALVGSYITDFLYDSFAWPLDFKIENHDHETMGFLEKSLGVFLIVLMAKGIYKEKVKPLMKKESTSCCG